MDKSSSLPESKNTKKEAEKSIVGGNVTGLAKKSLKRFIWNFLIELVPFLGGLYPGWTILVYKEMKGNLMGPEGVLMLSLAFLFDLIGFLFFAIGTWFAIDDYGTLDVIGSVIFGGWLLMRHALWAPKEETEEGVEEKTEEEKEDSKISQGDEKTAKKEEKTETVKKGGAKPSLQKKLKTH